jgi:hypothetical protein
VSVIAALWRAEASIERCAGRKKQAIAAWNRGAPEGMGGAWPVNQFKSATDIHLALDLWTTLGSSLMDNDEGEIEIDALASQEKSSNPSAASYNDELLNRRKRIADFLIKSGPWERPTQLPRNYTRGLRVLPWHTIDENDTESLLMQSFDIIFRELNNYIHYASTYRGIDWNTYLSHIENPNN